MINTRSLFYDKTTLILRELLATPDVGWTIRSLAEKLNISVGLVSRVVNMLDSIGLIEGIRSGRNGYASLANREKLLGLWTDNYKFEDNKISSYYSPHPNLKQIIGFLEKTGVNYALTLHSAANLITNYFPFDEYYIFVSTDDVSQLATELSGKLTLKRLTKGGNIHFVSSCYKTSVYYRKRSVKGISVVSNLQLYLDLYHFYPRGNDHAVYLKELLGEKIYG